MLELGCPVGPMQRSVRELADHRRDLIEAAQAKGMPAPAAEAWAEAKLGDPQVLAEDLMVSCRQSAWCSRHAFITFGLLPLLMFPVFWALVLFLCLSMEFAVGFGWNHKILHTAAENPTTFVSLVNAAHGADYTAIALVVLLFCLLGRRSAAGLKWVMLAGLICAVYSLFTYARVVPHYFSIGFTWTPQWIAAIPLSMVGIAYWNRRRIVRGALKMPI